MTVKHQPHIAIPLSATSMSAVCPCACTFTDRIPRRSVTVLVHACVVSRTLDNSGCAGMHPLVSQDNNCTVDYEMQPICRVTCHVFKFCRSVMYEGHLEKYESTTAQFNRRLALTVSRKAKTVTSNDKGPDATH